MNLLSRNMQGCDFSGIPQLLTCHLDLLSHDLVLGLRRVSRNPSELKGGGIRTLLRVLLRSAAEKRRLEAGAAAFNAETDLGLSDVMDSLLTQLDLSWLGPDPEATGELLDVVLIFVQALDQPAGVQQEPAKVDITDCDIGSVTQLLLGENTVH